MAPAPPRQALRQLPDQFAQQRTQKYKDYNNLNNKLPNFQEINAQLKNLARYNLIPQKDADDFDQRLEYITDGLNKMHESLASIDEAYKHAQPGQQPNEILINHHLNYANTVNKYIDQNMTVLQGKLDSAKNAVKDGEPFVEASQKIRRTKANVLSRVEFAENSINSPSNPTGFLNREEAEQAAHLTQDVSNLNKKMEEAQHLFSQGKGMYPIAHAKLKEAQDLEKQISQKADNFQTFLNRKESKALNESNRSTFDSIRPQLAALVEKGSMRNSQLVDIEQTIRQAERENAKSRDFRYGTDTILPDPVMEKNEASKSLDTATKALDLLNKAQQDIKSIDEKPKKKRVRFSDTPAKVLGEPKGAETTRAAGLDQKVDAKFMREWQAYSALLANKNAERAKNNLPPDMNYDAALEQQAKQQIRNEDLKAKELPTKID